MFWNLIFKLHFNCYTEEKFSKCYQNKPVLTLPSTESSAWQYVTLDPNFLKQAPLILQQHKGITSLSGGIGPGGACKDKT